jgi:hypothetical protein
MSALPPKADIGLFDHLVGAGEVSTAGIVK